MLFLDGILQKKRNTSKLISFHEFPYKKKQGSPAKCVFKALLTCNMLKYMRDRKKKMKTILSTQIKAIRLKHLYSSLKLIGHHYHLILLISERKPC